MIKNEIHNVYCRGTTEPQIPGIGNAVRAGFTAMATPHQPAARVSKWSHDGRYTFFEIVSGKCAICRVATATSKLEKVTNLTFGR